MCIIDYKKENLGREIYQKFQYTITDIFLDTDKKIYDGIFFILEGVEIILLLIRHRIGKIFTIKLSM